MAEVLASKAKLKVKDCRFMMDLARWIYPIIDP
jgi:hypothetical protein